MAAPAEDREGREHAHTGSENDRQELLRLVHVECPRGPAPWPQRDGSPSGFSLPSGQSGGKREVTGGPFGARNVARPEGIERAVQIL